MLRICWSILVLVFKAPLTDRTLHFCRFYGDLISIKSQCIKTVQLLFRIGIKSMWTNRVFKTVQHHSRKGSPAYELTDASPVLDLSCKTVLRVAKKLIIVEEDAELPEGIAENISTLSSSWSFLGDQSHQNHLQWQLLQIRLGKDYNWKKGPLERWMTKQCYPFVQHSDHTLQIEPYYLFHHIPSIKLFNSL